ncbi:MAG: PRC-barrel domain-containing protein [Acidobacteriota bacterium]
MLQSANDLKGFDIIGVDSKIGNIEEFYFDDQDLVVRYVVANTGNWLTGKQNLISPVFVTHLDRDKREIRLSLTKDQVEKCPGVDKHKPVSRQMEKIVSDYYGSRYYWDERPNLSPGQLAHANATSAMVRSAIEPGTSAALEPNVHLRSMQEISRYAITATDGDLGQVEDFFLEMDDWSIRYIGVDTGNWLPGKHVLISSMSLGQFNWSERTITVDLTRSQIETSPDYDKVTEVSREYQTRLHKHYGLQTITEAAH